MRPYERVSDKSSAWYLPLRVQAIINHGFKWLLQVFYGRHVTHSNGSISSGYTAKMIMVHNGQRPRRIQFMEQLKKTNKRQLMSCFKVKTWAFMSLLESAAMQAAMADKVYADKKDGSIGKVFIKMYNIYDLFGQYSNY